MRRSTIGVFVTVAIFMLTVGIYRDRFSMEFSPDLLSGKMSSAARSRNNNRKLLSDETGKAKFNETDTVVNPERIWSDKCSKSDIIINQGATQPLPSGIPTYTVEIINVCMSGCDISGIHLSCGWFSSARLVNPHIFKRVKFDDCLVNGGKPLSNGRTLSFQYANTFRYPMAVSSVTC